MSLSDLCLISLCKSANGKELLNRIPDASRQRLGFLFRTERKLQESVINLNLSGCSNLHDNEVRSLSSLKNLRELNLSHCEKLSGNALYYLTPLLKLETLVLNHCVNVSASFYYLQDLPSLRRLEVAFCEGIDVPIRFIAQLKNLTHLNLMCNQLSDEGCSKLSSLTNLVFLSLSMNPLITNATLKSLVTLTKLQIFNLNFCKLLSFDAIELLRKSIPSLKQVDMNGCEHTLLNRPLVLLAEDSKTSAQQISMVLRRYMFDVEIAINGQMALEMFCANPRYNLILMDVLMPIMDGPTCVRKIREYESANNLDPTPIIIQTADSRESQRTTCLLAGATEFLPKPLDKSMISLAKELMEARRPRQPQQRRNSFDRKAMEHPIRAEHANVNVERGLAGKEEVVEMTYDQQIVELEKQLQVLKDRKRRMEIIDDVVKAHNLDWGEVEEFARRQKKKKERK